MNLVVGDKHKVKAVKILSYGAIVEFEDGTTQLLHISNISDRFVRNVEDFITIGEFYTVDCIEGKVKSVELSMKAYTKDIVLPYHKENREG